jgi:putative transposase
MPEDARNELIFVYLTYRFRLLPTKRQHRALENILESQRELYNAALEERIGAFKKAGISRSYIDQCNALSEWRRTDADAKALPPNLQRATLKRLDDAFRGFFRRVSDGKTPGFPRFRAAGRFDSFGFREWCGILFRSGRLHFRGMPGGLRVHLHRQMPITTIKTCRFRRDVTGWTVSFVVEVEAGTPRRGTRVVGVDLGIRTFAALSDGGFIPSLRAARRHERQVRVAQRRLMRRKPGSAGRGDAKEALAREHRRIRNRRSNFLHQAAARLIRDYDTIVSEQMAVDSMTRWKHAKDVYDASWTMFTAMLRYKAEWAGARLVEVDSQHTTQECSGCGSHVPKLLRTAYHDCQHCGLQLDRDLNAARNILNRAGLGPGLPNVAGIGMRAGENLGSASAV